MKFRIDAQLLKRLAIWLATQGHDAKHTEIVRAFNQHRFVELGRELLVIHH